MNHIYKVKYTVKDEVMVRTDYVVESVPHKIKDVIANREKVRRNDITNYSISKINSDEVKIGDLSVLDFMKLIGRVY